MAEERIRGMGHRYLTALLFLVLLFLIVGIASRIIAFVIAAYFPAFQSDIVYVLEVSRAIIGIVGAWIVYRLLVGAVAQYELHRKDGGTARIARAVLRVIFYAFVIAIALIEFGPQFGITIGQALAGGAIGGVILGLAIQTVASSILSGFMVSSSKTIVPGEVIVLRSGSWGSTDILCRVVKVDILLTELVTANGNRLRVPNTMLLGSTIFTNLREGDGYCYPLPISVNSDVPAKALEDGLADRLSEEFQKGKHETPRFFLANRMGGTNLYTVRIKFYDFGEVNSLVNMANHAFDEAYWRAKSDGAPTPSRREGGTRAVGKVGKK